MGHPRVSDMKAFIDVKALAGGTLTAAGTGDNTEVTSSKIDRKGFGSCKVIVAGKTNAATGETLKGTLKIEESDDNTTFGAAETLASAVTIVSGGASAHEHRVERQAGADLRADDVPAARRAQASVLLSCAALRRRYRIGLQHPVCLHEHERLVRDTDVDLHRREAKKLLRRAADSAASTPP